MKAIKRFLSGLWAYRSAETYKVWLQQIDGSDG